MPRRSTTSSRCCGTPVTAKALRGDLAGRADVVPALGLTHEAGDALRAGLRGGEVVVRVTVDPGHETVPVTNLLAQRPDGAADPVLVGAHLDSVAESPGINDNASGVSVALAVAEELAARGALGARFAFWDGTEQGVLGSTAYVQALDQAALRSACRGDLRHVRGRRAGPLLPPRLRHLVGRRHGHGAGEAGGHRRRDRGGRR